MVFRPSLIRLQETLPPIWRPSAALDQWVQREARPISLRQLTFYGRSLTEERLLTSSNYVRTELPTRLSHRLRDMQTLPYLVLTNPHISHVYDLYFKAFDKFRTIPTIMTIQQNVKFCETIQETLQDHLSVIPNLIMGVIETQEFMPRDSLDQFVSSLLRSRISRRVIAEQHICLSKNFYKSEEASNDFVGDLLLKVNAKDVIERCAAVIGQVMQSTFGECKIPDLKLQGDMDATFPYISSHLEYIVGEILRNSMQAAVENHQSINKNPPPIEVLICETAQHVIMRFSDKSGGVPRDVWPYLWSFGKGPRKEARLQNLKRVQKMAATLQELQPSVTPGIPRTTANNSLSSISLRPPDLKLGIGLPMSKIFAEYWAGSLQVHNLEGFGLDTFLQISKLGNKNEEIITRASMDAV